MFNIAIKEGRRESCQNLNNFSSQLLITKINLLNFGFHFILIIFFSYITAIELLGNPSEMYTHGSQFWMICLSFILVVPITSYFYLPVFVNLKLTSSYEVSFVLFLNIYPINFILLDLIIFHVWYI